MKSAHRIMILVLVVILGPAVETGAAVLDVSWTAPTTNADGSALRDLSGYRLYLGTSTPSCGSSSYHTVSSSTAAPAANQRVSTSITGLNAGTTYRMRVSAVDRSGNESACSATVSGVAQGGLSVSPSSTVTFGSVPSGGSVDRTFTVQNTSGSTISGGASVGSPFSIVSGGSFSLAAGASRTVVVRFRPTGVGSFATNVNFTAQGDTVSRGVSGSATGSSGGSSAPPLLSVSRSGSGSGTVTSAPSGISCGSDCTQGYTAGTRVTLTARAASGSRFTGWSGGGCSGTGTCSVTVSSVMGVTATFAPASTGGGSTGGSRPDLVLTGLSMPSTVSRTGGFGMHFNVKNQGQAAAGALQVRIYLSRDNRVSSDDAVLRVRSFGAVAAGATIANGMTESIPSGTRAGSYYVLLVVDAGGTVGESNEGNNTVVKAITVR
jgi:CARDB protein/List-Bact-rpt repeat protein/centrosomal CEP192-like protein/fibronectin type III domain protein